MVRMKQILFDPQQLLLFEMIPKPVVSDYDTRDQFKIVKIELYFLTENCIFVCFTGTVIQTSSVHVKTCVETVISIGVFSLIFAHFHPMEYVRAFY